MALTFYTNVAKALKVKVRKFWGQISSFVAVAGEKLVVVVGGGGGEAPLLTVPCEQS